MKREGNRGRNRTAGSPTTEANMKGTTSADRSAAGSKTNRRGLLKTAALGGGALLGTNLLSAINNGAKAAGKPIPVGGGVPVTGWAAADGIEFKRGLEWPAKRSTAVGRHPGAAARAAFRGHQGTGRGKHHSGDAAADRPLQCPRHHQRLQHRRRLREMIPSPMPASFTSPQHRRNALREDQKQSREIFRHFHVGPRRILLWSGPARLPQ